MKTFDVMGKVGESGEYVPGSHDTGSHASYLVYGVLKPGEQGRELKPGRGHEELVLAQQGDLLVSGHYSGTLKQGRALHLRGEETVLVSSAGALPAMYAIAAGHLEEGHH